MCVCVCVRSSVVAISKLQSSFYPPLDVDFKMTGFSFWLMKAAVLNLLLGDGEGSSSKRGESPWEQLFQAKLYVSRCFSSRPVSWLDLFLFCSGLFYCGIIRAFFVANKKAPSCAFQIPALS